MHRILVLGAGMVAGPLVRHLLDRGCRLTVTSLAQADAEALIGGHEAGTPLVVDLQDEAALDALVARHDLVVSLVPYRFHPLVAGRCLAHRRHLVTASYVAPAMQDLDAAARDAGLVFLNEMGLDPGIDHMSAMRVIHDVQDRGGVITAFRSYCGGLPAPEAADNPLGYKFSWSPEGVLLASRNGATYLKDGRVVETAPERLFRDMHMLHVEGGGDFEAYPNRDSLAYRGIYGLGEGLRTLLRGTLRNPGWCDTMFHLRAVGLLDLEPRPCAGLTRGQYVRRLLGAADGEDIRAAAARRMGLCPEALPPSNLAWLGLGDDAPLAGAEIAPIAVLGQAMQQRLVFRPGERDMIVLHHEFQAAFAGGREERITSSMVAFGQPGGASAMARTVSLPAAIAALAILDGRIAGRGVLRPVTAEIYGPVLDELAGLGIVCTEKTTTFET